MLIWRGRGLVVLLAIFVAIGVQVLIDGMNGDGYYTSHSWPKVFSAIIAAIPIWFIGQKFENDGGTDHLWFVPVKFWAPIILVVGVIFAFSEPTTPARAAEPPKAVRSEPAPAPEPVRVAPAAQPAPRPVPVQQVSVIATKPRDMDAQAARSQRASIEFPKIAQVYADNVTKKYYAEDCASRPVNAYRMAKSLAVSQGFTPATCK